MYIKPCIDQIMEYITRQGSCRPKFVNIENVEAMGEFVAPFESKKGVIVQASSLCNCDQLPGHAVVLDTLQKRTQPTILTEWTTFLMFEGRVARKDAISSCMNRRFEHPVVVVCYQCESLLRELIRQDPRCEGQVLYLEGWERSALPILKIVHGGLQVESVNLFEKERMIVGIEKVASEIESLDAEILSEKVTDIDGSSHTETMPLKKTLIVVTHYNSTTLQDSLIPLHSIMNPLDMIRELDASVSNLTEDLGDDEQWGYLYQMVAKAGNVRDAILTELNIQSLSEISGYKDWNPVQRWFYFIALKLRGCTNIYISEVIAMTERAEDFIRNLYRAIADTSWTSESFEKKYQLRKNALNAIGNPENEATDYCRWIRVKKENALHYLTDNTMIERRTCLDLLGQYGSFETKRNRVKALERVWPALFQYLSEYHFEVPTSYNGPDLDRYFTDYKYQKVINRVSSEFDERVRNAGEQLQFYRFSKRSDSVASVCQNAKLMQTEVWFVDALGLEFMAALDAMCSERGLKYTLHIHRAELPTLTRYNTEFKAAFEAAGIRLHDVKDIDDLKHRKVVDEDYDRCSMPYHLIDELDRLKEVIRRIDGDLNYHGLEKAVIVSDHGASRLAVIADGVHEIQMEGNGCHAGRICCDVSKELRMPGIVRADNGDYVSANYDRFKGGRPAEVEVHGGATIEEVLVPFIEITKPGVSAQFEFVVDSAPIPVSSKDCAMVRIFSKTSFKSLKLRLQGGRYSGCEFEGTTLDGQHFEFECACITKSGKYTFDIYRDERCIKSGLSFETVSKGMSFNDDDW